MSESSGSDQEFNEWEDISLDVHPASSSSSDPSTSGTSNAVPPKRQLPMFLIWHQRLSKLKNSNSRRERLRKKKMRSQSLHDKIRRSGCEAIVKEVKRTAQMDLMVKRFMDYFEQKAKTFMASQTSEQGSTSEVDALESGLSNLAIGHGEVLNS